MDFTFKESEIEQFADKVKYIPEWKLFQYSYTCSICGFDLYNDKYKKMIDITNCDGVMIGRGALGNPWIFKQIINSIHNLEYTAPTINEIISVCIDHIKLLEETKNIYNTTLEILNKAEEDGITTSQAAIRIAEQRLEAYSKR